MLLLRVHKHLLTFLSTRRTYGSVPEQILYRVCRRDSSRARKAIGGGFLGFSGVGWASERPSWNLWLHGRGSEVYGETFWFSLTHALYRRGAPAPHTAPIPERSAHALLQVLLYWETRFPHKTFWPRHCFWREFRAILLRG